MQFTFPSQDHFELFLSLHEETQAAHLDKPFAEFDWLGYFEEFDREHGGEPVAYGDSRLLYSDGWMYSLDNLSGPEWKPPSNPKELTKLQIKYWQTRRTLVTDELIFLKRQLSKLTELQSTKSLPIKIIRQNTTERETIDLNLEEIQDRISWLADDSIDCDQHLKRLEGLAD